MTQASLNAALPFIAWSQIWSPVIPEELRAGAWEVLGLGDSYDTCKTHYWSTFHSGMPTPKVPLLLHAALDQEGAGVREDWLRVISHLELEWEDMHLPPDQLGVCCEIYACAIEREEAVLVNELRERYLLPWCDFALSTLQDEPLLFMAKQFKKDLVSLTIEQ
jgi:hypothetical protein